MLLLVNFGAIGVTIISASKAWYTARGHLRVVYWLMIAMGVLNLAVNMAVWAVQPSMWGVMSFQLLNVWGIAMGIMGLRRMNRERNN